MKNPREPLVSRGETGVSRRELMRMLGVTAGGAALFGRSMLHGRMAHAATTGDVRIASVVLSLDNTGTLLESAEGGNAVADVLVEPASGAPTLRKRTGTLRYEELRLQVANTMAAPLAAWINDTLLKGPVRKSGALLYYDFNLKEVKRLEFSDAVLAEISLPACDAGSQTNPFLITLCLAPASTRLLGPGGPAPTSPPPKQKVLMTHVFRLSIQGLEPATKLVQNVSAISARRPAPAAGGETKFGERSSAPLDCGIVSITLREKDAAPFYAWFADFVLKGNNGRDGERPGRLEWLALDMTTPVVTVELGNLGIVRYAPGMHRAGDDGASRTFIDMYCESWNLRL